MSEREISETPRTGPSAPVSSCRTTRAGCGAACRCSTGAAIPAAHCGSTTVMPADWRPSSARSPAPKPRRSRRAFATVGRTGHPLAPRHRPREEPHRRCPRQPEMPCLPRSLRNRRRRPGASSSPLRADRRTRRIIFPAAGAAVVAILGLLVAWQGGALHPRRASAHPRVLIAVFDNRTGDPGLQSLGRMTQDWLAQGLVRTHLVEVVDPRAVFVQGRADSGAAVDPIAIAHRTGASLVVSGSYYRTGDTLFFQAAVLDAQNERILRAVGPILSRARMPVAGLDELRSRVMSALASVVDVHATQGLGRGEPPPFDAYRDYVDGWDAYWHGDIQGARGAVPALGACRLHLHRRGPGARDRGRQFERLPPGRLPRSRARGAIDRPAGPALPAHRRCALSRPQRGDAAPRAGACRPRSGQFQRTDVRRGGRIVGQSSRAGVGGASPCRPSGGPGLEHGHDPVHILGRLGRGAPHAGAPPGGTGGGRPPAGRRPAGPALAAGQRLGRLVPADRGTRRCSISALALPDRDGKRYRARPLHRTGGRSTP